MLPLLCAMLMPSADLIVLNANIHTEDPARPRAEAVAVIGERIVAVGTSAEMRAWRGPHTQTIDAGGKLLLPGFNDAHVHFVSGGMQLEEVELKDAATPEEFARRIGERARTAPGEWILGGDWDEQKWPHPALPSKELIDPQTPQTPVFVSRYDGHMALANSRALALAGINAGTPDPAGGVIVRDAGGNPTGVLKDAALDLVGKVIPPPSRERRMRAVRRAMAHAASLGVTSVQDMNPDYADIDLYSELANERQLTLRIYAAPMIDGFMDQAKLGIHRSFGSAWLRVGAVKAYADGSLGSSTAYFFEPYNDQPDNRGLLVHPVDTLRNWFTQSDRAGLQLCVHAIGDQAISIVLDLFDQVLKTNGAADRRWRIEHAQHMAPADFDRMAKLQVIASVQPYHAIDDGRWAEARIGADRAKTAYAYRSFLEHGVRLALGTDWTVAPLNPLLTIYAAVTRGTLDGKHPGGWHPEQRISVEEAVRAYTVGSAYAEFQERDKGSIAAGKLADMVLLSRDIFSIPPEEIREVKVEKTIVGGRVVWDSN